LRYAFKVKILLLFCLFALGAEAAPQRRKKPAPRPRKPNVERKVERRAPQPTSPPIAEATEEASEPEPSSPPLDIKFSWGANVDLQAMYFPEKLSKHVGQSFLIGKGDLNGTLKVGRAFLAKVRPSAHVDPSNKSESEKYWVELPEGYAQLRLPLGESLTSYTQLGFNIFTWGVTDGFNPVDVVNPRRFHDPLRSEKLGVFALAEKLDFGSFLVEGIYIPKQRKSRLPGVHSRWLPREIDREYRRGTDLFRFTEEHSFYFRPDEEVDQPLEHNAGLRVGAKILGADFAGYYFNGAATVPATSLRLTGAVVEVSPSRIVDADPPIGIRPVFYRNQMYGGSVVFPIWDILVRYEQAHTRPTKSHLNVPVSSDEGVLELEHTFSWENQSLTAIALGTWANRVDPEGITSSSASISRMFDRGVALGFRYQPLEQLLAEGFILFDTKYGGRLHKLDLTYTLNDLWKVYAGGDVFTGKTHTPIGVYRANDRFWAGLKLGL
jgi:hypothetical protein